MNRIGIFGGVFDPIHLGHTEFIKKSVKEHGLNKVYILVEREPKFKTCLAGYEHRKQMTKIAISDIPEAELYDSNGKSFPITTNLPKIKAAYPGSRILLLLGDDVAEHIDEWDGAEDLLKGVELIVAKRGQEHPLSRISSLKIRRNIKRGKIDGLDPEVLDYIRSNNLYGPFLITGE